MNQERIDKVAENAWELAHVPVTDLEASALLKDCVFTIKLLQSRIEALEKDAARYRWLRDHYHGFEHYRSDLAKKLGIFERDIDTAMQANKGD